MTGKPIELLCTALPLSEDSAAKPKSTIQWVPASHAVSAEVRVYNSLFVTEEPSDEKWEEELNPDSEVIYTDSLVDASIFKWNPKPETHFQFERLGFFVTDFDSPPEPVANDPSRKLIFNMTVSLRDSKPKAAGAPNKSRKEEQAKQLAEKQVINRYYYFTYVILLI